MYLTTVVFLNPFDYNTTRIYEYIHNFNIILLRPLNHFHVPLLVYEEELYLPLKFLSRH